MNTNVDELPNGDIIIGKSLPDTLDNELKWSIKKLTNNNEDLNVRYAENSSTFNKSWDLRSTYIY